jgi:hypothetical protein
MYGKQERCIEGFGGRREGERPLGRPMCRWEDHIKIDLPRSVMGRRGLD